MPLVAVAVLSCHDSSSRACPCLAALGLCSCEGSSLGAAPRLLIAVASPVAKHGLQGFRAPESWSTGLVASRHVEYSRTRGRTCVPPHPLASRLQPLDHRRSPGHTFSFLLVICLGLELLGHVVTLCSTNSKKIILISW